jgi:hypothetical protein
MLNPPRNVPATTGIKLTYTFNGNTALGGFTPIALIEDNSGYQVTGVSITNTNGYCGIIYLPCASSVVIKDIQVIMRVVTLGSQSVINSDIKIIKIETY